MSYTKERLLDRSKKFWNILGGDGSEQFCINQTSSSVTQTASFFTQCTLSLGVQYNCVSVVHNSGYSWGPITLVEIHGKMWFGSTERASEIWNTLFLWPTSCTTFILFLYYSICSLNFNCSMQNIRTLRHANVSSGDSSLHRLNFRWKFSHNIRSRYCASMVPSSQAWPFARTYCGPLRPCSNFKLHLSCVSSSTSDLFPPHRHQIILTLLNVHYSENQFTLRLLGWSTVEFPASSRSISATAASMLRLVILGTWLAGDKSYIMVFFCLLHHVRSFPIVVRTQFFFVTLPQSDDDTQPPSTSYSPCHSHPHVRSNSHMKEIPTWKAHHLVSDRRRKQLKLCKRIINSKCSDWQGPYLPLWKIGGDNDVANGRNEPTKEESSRVHTLRPGTRDPTVSLIQSPPPPSLKIVIARHSYTEFAKLFCRSWNWVSYNNQLPSRKFLDWISNYQITCCLLVSFSPPVESNVCAVEIHCHRASSAPSRFA